MPVGGQQGGEEYQIQRIQLAGTFDSRDSATNTSPTKDFQLVNAFLEQAGDKVLVCPRRVTSDNGLTAVGSTLPNGFGIVYRVVSSGVRPVVLASYDDGVGTTLDVWRINSGSSAFSTHALPFTATRLYMVYGAFGTNPRVLLTCIDNAAGAASYYNPQADTVAPVVLPTTNELAHGVAQLDGYFFVMDSTTGLIWNSDLQNGLVWGATNYIQASVTSSRGVWIGTHMNYVVAFMDFSIEFFYDAARPNGSPLGHVPNATIQVGCAAGATVADVSGNKVWVAQNTDGTRFVAMMAAGSTAIKKVSTPQVDRILQDQALQVTGSTYARGIGYDGHTFYLLDSGGSSKFTLVYDLTTDKWTIWTTTNAAGQTIAFSEKFAGFLGGLDEVTGQSKVITIGTLTGKVSQLVEGSTDLVDSGSSSQVYAQWQGELLDNGYLGRKFYSRASPVGDKGAYTVDLSYSSDDYANFTAARSISMNQVRPEARNLGWSRRRAWKMRWQNSAVNSSRLEALELEFKQGPI